MTLFGRRPAQAVEPPWLAHMVADLDALEADERGRDAWRARPARRPLRAGIAWLAAALTALVTTACATTGATFRSGVGDAFLERPPYYAGAAASSAGGGRVGHLPISYQRGAAQPAGFDPATGRETAVARLLADMNRFLDSLGTSGGAGVRLVALAAPAAAMTAPDVSFGCATVGNLPGEDCVARGDSALGRGRQTMRLAVGRPSAEWTAWARGAARSAGVERVLVITLEVGQYLPRQTGWRGEKVVELGTGHSAKLPWLTSLETPAAVLQLTGALVDTTGRAIRVGAEGFAVRRTRLAVSAIGAQELLADEDVEAAHTARRDDLPGSPPAWQLALRHLVAQLAGRTVASGS